MKMIPFFTDDITVIPHTVSAELAHLIGKPVTLAQLQAATGAPSVALYELPNGDLYAALRPTGPQPATPLFIEGPETAAELAA